MNFSGDGRVKIPFSVLGEILLFHNQIVYINRLKYFCKREEKLYICIVEQQKQHAQLAELVDALVSNTNIFGCAGSTPALGTNPSLH